MNIGIISEYNPFHNGHLLHLNKSKTLACGGHVVVVMSGNFVQRGEPAIFDKWARTKMALLNGASLVLELPVMYSTAGADLFAYGAISVLEKTGIVDGICFGSETGDIDLLLRISEALSNETEQFKDILKSELKKGLPFPAARLNALSLVINENLDFLKTPNNILGIEYLRSIKKIKSNMKPFTIKREVDYHSSEINGTLSSAKAIREAILKGRAADALSCIPQNCKEIFHDCLEDVHTVDDFSGALAFLLRTKEKEELKGICDISEGLENRIIKNAERVLITDLIEAVKTKRYTYTKLQRALLHIVLDLRKADLDYYNSLDGPMYIRVLGFRRDSEDLIRAMSERALLPVVMNLKNSKKLLTDFGAYEMLLKEIRSTDIYFLNNRLCLNYEFKKPVVIV